MIKISYAGYSQFLCKKGHTWNVDCYELPNLMYEEDVKQKCPICGEEEVWTNRVDLTNGSWDDKGNRIDRYVELKSLQKQTVACLNCGDEHLCKCSTYQIPGREMKND